MAYQPLQATCDPADDLMARYETRVQSARHYRQWAHRVIVSKRVFLASIIFYTVFDPTVSVVLVPMLIFLIPIVLVQHRLVSKWHRQRRAVMFYYRAVERMQGNWHDFGDTGDRFRDSHHPYSDDLDIFGSGSLFHLLCSARTGSGQDALASWLRVPADSTCILTRQQAVQELRDCLDIREALDEAGAQAPNIEMEIVRSVADAPRIFTQGWMRFLMASLAWGLIASFVIGFNTDSLWWDAFLIGVVVETAIYLRSRKRVLALCRHGHEMGLSLVAVSLFSRVMRQTTWQSCKMQQLAATICRPPRPVGRSLATIQGLLAQLPIVHFLLVQLAPMTEARLLNRLGQLPTFWGAVGQCEAISAFAEYAFEHPNACFPEIVEQGCCFVATELAHPLIPQHESVQNDIRLDSHLQLVMVSGSNMSGKSTMLRTVGVNAVLALAGAPVRAASLSISPLVIGSAMRFQDSLERGTSYFHAVLCKLRQVLELSSGPTPLLFLLDEILQGTNSHDRLTGAEAVIHRLLSDRSIGLVTTHDLELTQIVVRLAPAAINVHFTDEIIDGELSFDYQMRPGIVQSSNALTLMRQMGLDV